MMVGKCAENVNSKLCVENGARKVASHLTNMLYKVCGNVPGDRSFFLQTKDGMVLEPLMRTRKDLLILFFLLNMTSRICHQKKL